ncbi:MAG: hypothetical protein BV458_13115 [Thermoplasmata archaeon M9B2D]|nr:MAG: hypothetical protein BV458_13115 [Thermoplasmata archaeon M9B2D]
MNEKIEGFFELCKSRGLDGSHGVIIPQKNVINLMLNQDVIDAIEEGQFRIYAIDTMEEGMEILTGMKTGALSEDGTYPEGSINFLIEQRLTAITEALREKKDKKNNDSEENEGPRSSDDE